MLKKETTYFLLVVFLIFFTESYFVNTAYPFSTDDWAHAVNSRVLPIPLWDVLNPIAVLPEYLQTFCSYLGAYVFAPILKLVDGKTDYIEGMALAYSLFFSMLYTAYFYVIFKILKLLIQDKKVRLFGVLLVVILHFSLFNLSTVDHTYFYLYHFNSITSLYHDTVPMLCNAILVLVCEYNYLKGKSILPTNKIAVILLIVFAYLCIFSSTTYNIVSATYFAVILLLGLFDKALYSSLGLVNFVKANWFCALVVALWMVCAVFDFYGLKNTQNAESVNPFASMSFKQFSKSMISIYSSILNNVAFYLLILSVIVAVLNCVRRFNSLLNVSSLRAICSLVLVTLFYLMMGRDKDPFYSIKGFQIGSAFYLILMLILLYATLYNKFKARVLTFVPLILLLLVAPLLVEHSITPHNKAYLNFSVVYDFDNYIVSKSIEAIQNNLQEVVIEIPSVWNKADLVDIKTGGDVVATAFYKLGIIPHNLMISLSPSDEQDLYDMLHIVKP